MCGPVGRSKVSHPPKRRPDFWFSGLGGDGLSKKGKQHDHGPKAAGNSEKPTCHVEPEWSPLHAEIAQRHEDDKQHNADERDFWKRQLRVAKWLNWITGGAAIVSFVGLYILWRNLGVSKSAADAAERALSSQQAAFQTDQRPYVVTDGMPQFVTFPNLKTKTQANVILKDIGKTPATNAVWFVDLLPYRATTRAGFLTIVETSFANLRKRRDDTINQHSAEIRRDISPTLSAFSTEESRPLLATEMADLVKGDGSFILLSVGVVNYTDGFKGAYETEFCYFFAGPDPKVWHLCDSHNTIK
jgi:hypothetical protein